MTKKETTQPKSGKGEAIISTVVNILLVFAIILAFICTYTAYVTKQGSGVPSLLGYSPFAIQSDSMKPFFEKGDLVITKVPEDTSALKVGDVITFWTIINGSRVLNTHRIASVEDGGTYTYYITKGDNNNIPDAMTVHQSEIVGVYSTHIGKLGTVLDFLQTSKGFFLIVVLPVFVFFVYYLVEFFRALFAYQAEKNREKYREEMASANKTQGGMMFNEEQLQQMLAKALLEAQKQNNQAQEASQVQNITSEKDGGTN